MLPFTGNKAMRDALIEKIYAGMQQDPNLFFLSADFGAPALDKIRKDFPGNFASVGIAEQNLVNVAAGLSYEGLKVFAYAISAFLTMRAFEQIKINFALHAECKNFNVNLVGVGAGLSYDISGPSHHCLEDISIINSLPNILIFSPSDSVMVGSFFEALLALPGGKYYRFDSKPLPAIYTPEKLQGHNFSDGFVELQQGADICLLSTGYMTHQSLKIIELLKKQNINAGLLDFYLLNKFDKYKLAKILSGYSKVITLEEGFIGRGGFDAMLLNFIQAQGLKAKFKAYGFKQGYIFDRGHRELLHKNEGLSPEKIVEEVGKL